MNLKDTTQTALPEDPLTLARTNKGHKKRPELVDEEVTDIADTDDIQEPAFSQQEIDDIIKEYILNGSIEKTYTSKMGLTITLAAPTQGQLMQALAATDEEVFDDDNRMSMDRMQLIKNNNILAIYTRKYNKKDYAAEQGEAYYTDEGFTERREHLLNGSTMNVFAMDWAIKRLNEFQAMVTAAFDESNLKNI